MEKDSTFGYSMVGFALLPELKDELNAYAKSQDLHLSQLLRRIVKDFLKRKGKV